MTNRDQQTRWTYLSLSLSLSFSASRVLMEKRVVEERVTGRSERTNKESVISFARFSNKAILRSLGSTRYFLFVLFSVCFSPVWTVINGKIQVDRPRPSFLSPRRTCYRRNHISFSRVPFLCISISMKWRRLLHTHICI